VVGGEYVANLIGAMLVLAVANGLGNATAIVLRLRASAPTSRDWPPEW
jgi:hypothetical protein